MHFFLHIGQLLASTPVAESELIPVSILVADVPPVSKLAPNSMNMVGTHCLKDTCECELIILLLIEPHIQALLVLVLQALIKHFLGRKVWN